MPARGRDSGGNGLWNTPNKTKELPVTDGLQTRQRPLLCSTQEMISNNKTPLDNSGGVLSFEIPNVQKTNFVDKLKNLPVNFSI